MRQHARRHAKQKTDPPSCLHNNFFLDMIARQYSMKGLMSSNLPAPVGVCDDHNPVLASSKVDAFCEDTSNFFQMQRVRPLRIAGNCAIESSSTSHRDALWGLLHRLSISEGTSVFIVFPCLFYYFICLFLCPCFHFLFLFLFSLFPSCHCCFFH